MSGFVPMDAGWWPFVADSMTKPWPREAALFDLRWHADRERMGRGARPGRPALVDRWGWTDWQVKQAIKGCEWLDSWTQEPVNPVNQTASAPPARRQRAASGGTVEPDESGKNHQPTASAPPADRLTRADHPSPITDHPDPDPDPCTPEPPDGPHDPDPVPGPAGDVPGGEQAAAPDGPAPDALAGRPRSARGAGGGGASAAGGGVKADDARMLYEVYHRAWPSRSATPTHDSLAAMRRILHECGGLDRAGVYLAWVAQAEDVWARRIRGAEPWPDGTTKARLDAVSLSRNIPGRLDEALAWDARGRTTPADAPKASEPDRVAALVSMLEELADHGGDPDLCADPAKSRRVLAVWYGHGGGPASVASLAMRDRTFALRDIATAMVRARVTHEAARAEAPRG